MELYLTVVKTPYKIEGYMMANSNYSEFLYYGLQYVVLEEAA